MSLVQDGEQSLSFSFHAYERKTASMLLGNSRADESKENTKGENSNDNICIQFALQILRIDLLFSHNVLFNVFYVLQ